MSEADQPVGNTNARPGDLFPRTGDFPAVLLAMAGHDLRQPLQVIQGAYAWLSKRLNTSSELEYLRRGELAIAQLTEQLDHLIDGLRLHERAAGIGHAAASVVEPLPRQS